MPSSRSRRIAGPLVLVALSSPGCGARAPEASPEPDDRIETDVEVNHATVVRVDAASGEVRAVVPVGPDPLLLSTASGQIWTLNLGDGTLSRIDPATEEATHVSVGEAVGIASDDEDLWVAHDGNIITRLDGASGREETSLRPVARRLFAPRDAGFLAAGTGSLWLTVPDLEDPRAPQSLWRVDPRDGAVLARLPLAPDPLPPLAQNAFIWIVTMGDQGLTRVDAGTMAATEIDVAGQPFGLAAGADAIWLGHASGVVSRIDPERAEVVAEIPVDGTVRNVAFGAGLVWVAVEDGLRMIDPATNDVVGAIPLGGFPRDTGPIGIAELDGSIWVSIE